MLTGFSVRKAVWEQVRTQGLLWVRDKDVFPAPSQTFQQSGRAWEDFTTDCAVYSLFAPGSNQRSHRGRRDTSGRIANECFWRSREHVRELAQAHGLLEVEQDLDTDTERCLHTYLAQRETSPQAAALLGIANRIHAASMRYRRAYSYERPTLDLLTWDAGWWQVNKMCFSRDALPAAKHDAHLQALHEEFKQARRTLGEKIAARYCEDTGF